MQHSGVELVRRRQRLQLHVLIVAQRVDEAVRAAALPMPPPASPALLRLPLLLAHRAPT